MDKFLRMPKVELFDKEVVLDRIMQLFWKKGYHDTSMQDIVEISGLGRSSIYNSFGSKREIFLAVLSRYQKEMKSHFQDKIASISNPLEAIESILLWNLDVAKSDKDKKGCFIVNTRTEMSNVDGALNIWIKNDQDKTLKIFNSLVQKGQKNGTITTAFGPSSLSTFLYSTMIGLRATAMTSDNYEQLNDMVKFAIKALKRQQKV